MTLCIIIKIKAPAVNIFPPNAQTRLPCKYLGSRDIAGKVLDRDMLQCLGFILFIIPVDEFSDPGC